MEDEINQNQDEEFEEKDSEAIVDGLRTLKEGIIEAKRMKQHPEIAHLTDHRLGITLELHSCKIEIHELTQQALKTFDRMKNIDPTKRLSMIS